MGLAASVKSIKLKYKESKIIIFNEKKLYLFILTYIGQKLNNMKAFTASQRKARNERCKKIPRLQISSHWEVGTSQVLANYPASHKTWYRG